ncbi:MAG: hypothetical protein U0Q03_02085 [Acidimicrobiales bacterium]
MFQGLTPARLLDTRSGAGISTIDGQALGGGQVGAGATLNLTVTNRGGVPASGVAAVALNVTATEGTAASYITAFPTGSTRPTASNLNTLPNQSIANMVIVPVGTNGQISLFNFAGSTHLVADVLGYFPTGSVNGLNPARLMDTRADGSTVDGQAKGGGAVGNGGTTNLTVLGRGGVPASGVGAVALNVTATEGTGSSYVTVWPTGQTRPTASNLNTTPGQTVPNMVIVPVGSGGQISLFNFSGNTHLIVDVLAWFPSATASITGVTPQRLLETRSGLSTIDNAFNATNAIPAGGQQSVTVVGRGTIPASGVAAVALNVTATNPSSSSYLTVWPKGQTKPTASNLNFTPGQTVPNMVIVPVGANGQVNIFNFAGTTDVIVDILAWFPDNATSPTTTTTTTVPANPAPVTQVSTRTGGAQGAVTLSPSTGIFTLPADDPIDGLVDPDFYYSEGPAINTNGTYVAFSTFLQLDPQDQDDVMDVYRKNLATGAVELVSVPTGAPDGSSGPAAGGTASATEPAISADGNIVVFMSGQTLLDGTTDANGNEYDIFARNMTTQTTVRLTNGNNTSTYPDISDDGAYITFQSRASNIVAGDTNAAQDGFVMRINPATMAVVDQPARVTLTSAGAEATCAAPTPANCNGGRGYVGSFDMRISDNGQVVVFSSDADNIVAGDNNGERDVFRITRATASTFNAASVTRLSVDSNEVEHGGGTSDDPQPNGDGSLVVFHSRANGLDINGDDEDGFEVFLRNVTAGTTTVMPGGNGAGNHPMISSNGQYVSYASTSANMVTGDTNGNSDVFLVRVSDRQVTRLSVTAANSTNDFTVRSVETTLDGTGSKIAFISLAPLAAADNNNVADIYLYTRA